MYVPSIERFAIKGLHYYQNFEITFDGSPNILVGENGIGKTTIISSLYYLLIQNWYYLLDNAFDFIELDIDGKSLEFSYSELEFEYNASGLMPGRIHEDSKLFEVVKTLEPLAAEQMIYFPAFRNLQDDF